MQQLDTRRERTWLVLVAVGALALRLAVSSSFKSHSYVATDTVKPEPEAAYLKRGEIGLGDSEQYLLLAGGIRHLRFSWDHEPVTFRPPGYPLLLALLGNSTAGIIVVQALLAGLAVFLLGLTGQRLFGFRAGILAAGLAAVDVPSVLSAGVVMAESLLAFTVVLAVHLFLRDTSPTTPPFWEAGESRIRRWFGVGSGLLMGFAVLVRPVALMMSLPFAVSLALGRRWRKLAVFLAAAALFPAAWSVRNFSHFGRFDLTSNGGYNLLYANAAALLADQRHATWDEKRLELARSFTQKLQSDNPLILARAMTGEALRVIAGDPLRYAWVLAKGVPSVMIGVKSDDIVKRVLSGGLSATDNSVTSRSRDANPALRLLILVLAGLEVTVVLCVLVLALASLVQRRSRGVNALLVSAGLYFLLAALPFTDGRFRVPVMPFLYLASASFVFRNDRRQSEDLQTRH
jgi:4-amino-4-deoxy-L-arabinose transferase-like glycosyltransferase